jgi:RNA-binding protein
MDDPDNGTMPAIALTIAQRRAKRADAHHLNPVAMVGNDGLSDAVVREVDVALKAHELVKVRVHNDDRDARQAMLVELADRLGAAPVQHIGKLLVLWRPKPAETDRAPAGERGARPKVVKIVKFAKSGNHRPTVRKVKVLGNQRVTVGGEIKKARARKASLKKQSLA